MKHVGILGDKVEVADTLFAKVRGLMFRENIVPVLFVFNYSDKHPIHSCFVFGDFEAVYINSKGYVVDIFHVKPFTLWLSNKTNAKYLLEVPEGWCERHNIKIGSKIDFQI